MGHTTDSVGSAYGDVASRTPSPSTHRQHSAGAGSAAVVAVAGVRRRRPRHCVPNRQPLHERGTPGGPGTRDHHFPPKKRPHGIGANDRPLTNLVRLRKLVGLVVKEEEQPWLRGHGFLPPSQFALWPGTSVWDFLRVLHDYF